MRLVQQPTLQWVNSTKNVPVAQGFMYFGVVGQDPKIPENQITVFRKNQINEYVEVQQPISLSDSGVPIYLGQEMTLYVEEDCAIRVDDRNGAEQYLIRQYFGAQDDTLRDDISALSGIKALKQVEGVVQTTLGYNTDSGVGGYQYVWNPTRSWLDHNGGAVLSSQAMAVYDGTTVTLAAFLNFTPTAGSGCWELMGDWSCPTSFGAVTGGLIDDTAAIAKCFDVNTVTDLKSYTYKAFTSGSIVRTGVSDKKIKGDKAKLIKGGTKGMFYFVNSNKIDIDGVVFDGNVTVDEAAAGSVLEGTRSPSNYAYAVVFENCTNCAVHGCEISNFAWDGIVSYGIVAPGGLSATYCENIAVYNNIIKNVRNTMVWTKANKKLSIYNNKAENDESFEQKGNFTFLVEFTDGAIVCNNDVKFIGDNAVGVGEQINQTIQARNKNILIDGNVINTTRYHSILIAQAENCVVSKNIISKAGAKSEMFPSSAVLCSAITAVGGTGNGVTQKGNKNVLICENVIEDSYEIGIYAYDRVDSIGDQLSSAITIKGNKINRVGNLPLAGRLAIYGIYTVIKDVVDVVGNEISFVENEGIRCFGNPRIMDNLIRDCSSFGINIPSDTLLGATEISNPISRNTCLRLKRSGIRVAGRKVVNVNGNCCESCGIDTAPATENISSASDYCGISFYQVDAVYSSNNICRYNGSSGIVFRPSSVSLNTLSSVNDNLTGNGAVFTVQNLRSGFYGEGTSGINMAATFINAGGYAELNQQYPIRLLFGGNSVSVDEKFDTHPLASLGVTKKSLINI